MVKECRNCGSKDLRMIGGILECPFCGSQYQVELKNDEIRNIDMEQNNSLKQGEEDSKPKESNARILFDYDLRGFESCKKSTKKLVADIMSYCNNDNYFYNLTNYEEGLTMPLNEMTKKMPRLATLSGNRNLLNTVQSRIKKLTAGNERVIAYMDVGLVSKGKRGTLVTSDALYFVNGNNVKVVTIADIKKIVVKDESCNSIYYFADDEDSELKMQAYCDNGDITVCGWLCVYIVLRRWELNKSKVKFILA